MRFEALPNGGTRVWDAVKMHMPVPRFIRSALLKYALITQHHYEKAMALAAQLASDEYNKAKSE